MGKITSLIEIQGKVGNLVGYKGKDGRNVVRKRSWNVRNAKSTLQMRRRVAWANMVNVWKALEPYMEPSFENKEAGQSDYNAYTQANADANCVYLTKKESRMGVTVVAPYTICRGTLEPVGIITISGGKMRSDIALGDLTIDGETTVSAFSKAVINNNDGWEEGDQITCVILGQSLVGEEQVPRVTPNVAKIILDKTSNEMVWDVVSDEGFSSNDGYLCSKSTVNGGMCWIKSRIVDGKTLVSNAELTVNNTLLETYQSETQQETAMKSYGCKGSKYLTPEGNRYRAGATF